MITKSKLARKLCVTVLSAALSIGALPVLSNTVNAAETYKLSGTAHVQDLGDVAGTWDETTGILTLGTRGQGRRVEAITIDLENDLGHDGTLMYKVHVQDYGWQEYCLPCEKAGTSGEAKRLEGIEMILTGELGEYYDIEYCVHIEDYGDAQGWVSNGALAGTTGESKRLEEVKVRIVPKASGETVSVNYRVHRQDYGWESEWKCDGQTSGTTGEAKRLEGIEIHISGGQHDGGIMYRTHVQNIGWESSWSYDGEMSGTQGMSYRLEAIQIMLYGDICWFYDVYYRVHAEDYGWLGWAKNGESSGTSGLGKRLEAIQIVLIPKGDPAPGDINGVTSVKAEASVEGSAPVAASGNIAITEKNFPDTTFRNYISSSFDANYDGYLSPEEIKQVQILGYCPYGDEAKIKDLTGIGYFTELEELYIYGNDLSSVDLSKNKKLMTLLIDDNSLTKLDVSQNPRLQVLSCANNKLTSLDVSKNPMLSNLNCENNQLTSIDLSHNPKIMYLFMTGNNIKTLDLHSNHLIKSIWIDFGVYVTGAPCAMLTNGCIG